MRLPDRQAVSADALGKAWTGAWRWLVSRQGGVFVGGVAVGLAVMLLPAPEGVPHSAMLALGLMAFTVIMWATAVIPPPLTAVIFIVLAALSGSATMPAIVSGFVSNSVWLVFGGLLIGSAAERSGFGRWVARHFLAGFRGSYASLILGILLGTAVLSFLVPSNMGRIAISIPIILALAKEAGYEIGTPAHIGLIVTTVIGNFTTAIGILPANLLNIMIVGTGEALYGTQITYVQYLVMCLPVLGIGKGLLVWVLVPRLYPAPAPRLTSEGMAGAGVLSQEGIRVAAILGVAILAWATDFMHGIRPGWIALGAGLLCVMPRIGVLPVSEIFDRRKLEIVVWIAGVLTLASVLSDSGASTLISRILAETASVEGKSPTYGYFAIAYLTSLVAVFATMGGTVPTMAAVVGGISEATNLPLETGMLAVSAGTSGLLFPYVAAPMVAGLAFGKVSMADATRFTVISTLFTWVFIVPLNALWWQLIGALP